MSSQGTREVVKAPRLKPFTREPIKPVERHRDKKKDFKRQDKHDRWREEEQAYFG